MTIAADLPPFLDELRAAATSAQTAELQFRDSIAREVARLERARQFAFRRLEVARMMAAAAGRAGVEDDKAVAAQIATLRSEFGWHGDNEHNRKVVEAWRPVALAVWQGVAPAQQSRPHSSAAPVAAAMADFEAWYEREFGRNYLAILDHEIPEMPVVEF